MRFENGYSIAYGVILAVIQFCYFLRENIILHPRFVRLCISWEYKDYVQTGKLYPTITNSGKTMGFSCQVSQIVGLISFFHEENSKTELTAKIILW